MFKCFTLKCEKFYLATLKINLNQQHPPSFFSFLLYLLDNLWLSRSLGAFGGGLLKSPGSSSTRGGSLSNFPVFFLLPCLLLYLSTISKKISKNIIH